MKPDTWANHSGSSPLTRGKPDKTGVVAPTVGLIPAHAGKTTISKLLPTENRAHPRSRGENLAEGEVGCNRIGSSPLTRGKLTRRDSDVPGRGLIPAHAGKTLCGFSPSSTNPAHPRSRGENFWCIAERSCAKGSSPLTRGKLLSVLGGSLSPRLIPAHAGKTQRCDVCRITAPAHPRSRGENVVLLL